jgi:hypothetical protein
MSSQSPAGFRAAPACGDTFLFYSDFPSDLCRIWKNIGVIMEAKFKAYNLPISSPAKKFLCHRYSGQLR